MILFAGFQAAGTRGEAMIILSAGFREVGAAVYGDPYMHRLGFDGNTPQDPTAVDRLAGQVLSSVK